MNWYNSAPVNCFIKLTGYTYTNLARLFMRLFVGVMLLQFGIRHLVNYDLLRDSFPTVLHMSSECSLIIMIIIELVCSLFLMVGFLTRLSVIPPICAMIAAEYYILHDMVPNLPVYGLDSTDPGYLPIMFIGIYIYILIAGAGKISLDYFISLYLIGQKGKYEEEELEDV
ncbi:MAG: DoxX family protein [Duncaniella sp.]|uniref:DoxX family protein n=1 Tax=Duncaniella sp. TaxID=2518496 RepID=UPI0019ABF310|nr:DoxX family protein [Duncaniella sp.]MBD5334378.1 DoxX family protein [Bacteroides sp.]MDE6090792.1 DoxX family protein [Duncaniella sp.]